MNARTALALGLLLGACQADGGARVTVRDSAGITIVENAFPDSARASWWRLEAEPVVDIGGADAEESTALHQVGDALRLADGRIVVSNGSSADVRYYSNEGTHLRTTGRRGNGPGEFQRPGRLIALPGDSVLVVEGIGGRMAVLDSAGVFARDFTLDQTGPGIGVLARMSDGTFTATRSATGGGAFRSGFQRAPVIFVSLSGAGVVQDTIVSVPGTEAAITIDGNPARPESIRSIQVNRPPFTKQTVFAAAGDVLAVATQEVPEVRVYGQDGALRRIIRTSTPMPEVTQSHLDAWFERTRASMPREFVTVNAPRPDYSDAGKVVPPFAAIEIDDAGNIWLADFDDRIREPGTWSVHDAEGRLLARIRLARTFRPMHIGSDFLLGVERDEMDIEHVRLYRLISPK